MPTKRKPKPQQVETPGPGVSELQPGLTRLQIVGIMLKQDPATFLKYRETEDGGAVAILSDGRKYVLSGEQIRQFVIE